MNEGLNSLNTLRAQQPSPFFEGLLRVASEYIHQTTEDSFKAVTLSLTYFANSFKGSTLASQRTAMILWQAVKPDFKTRSAEFFFELLGNQTYHAHASKCISSIFTVDILINSNSDLARNIIAHLCTSDSSNQTIFENTIQTLGFIVEDSKPALLKPYGSQILSRISEAISKSSPENQLAEYSAGALEHSIKFASDVMKSEEIATNLDTMIKFLCSSIQTTETRTYAMRAYALCMTHFYQYAHCFLGGFTASFQELLNEPEAPSELKAAAIRVWDSLAIAEKTIDDANYASGVTTVENRHLLDNYAEQLIGVIASGLINVDDDTQIDDQSYIYSYSSTLNNITISLNDEKVLRVLNYGKQLISSENWKSMFAGTKFIAAASTVAMLSEDEIKDLIVSVFGIINNIELNLLVRYSASETLWAIAEYLGNKISFESANNVFRFVCENHKYHPAEIVSNFINVVYDLARHYGIPEVIHGNPAESIIGANFVPAVTAMLEITSRSDAFTGNLIYPAYNALFRIIHSSPDDLYEMTTTMLTPTIFQKIESCRNATITSADMVIERDLNISGLVGACCAILTRFNSVPVETSWQINDLLISLLNTTQRDGSAIEIIVDVFDCLSAVIAITGPSYQPHTNTLYNLLKPTISDPPSTAAFSAALGVFSQLNFCDASQPAFNMELVGVLSNFCRNAPDIVPYAPEIIRYFSSCISRTNINYQALSGNMNNAIKKIIEVCPDPTDLDNVAVVREIYYALLNYYSEHLITCAMLNIGNNFTESDALNVIDIVSGYPSLRSSLGIQLMHFVSVLLHINPGLQSVLKQRPNFFTLVQHLAQHNTPDMDDEAIMSIHRVSEKILK